MVAFAKRDGSGRHGRTLRVFHRAGPAAGRPKHWRPFLLRFFDAFRLAY